jgi:hypothetical protein
MLFGRSLILLSLACATTFGQEDPPFVEICWRVSSDGRVVVWPDEQLREDNLRFSPLFPLTPDVLKNPGEFLTATGWPALAALALSGSDILAATDAEYHFRKLRLGTHPFLLDTRVHDPARYTARGRPEPLVRRAQLDRILALRLAAAHKVEWLRRSLDAFVTDPSSNPFLRAVAQRELVRLTGKAARSLSWRPEELPADCTFYACIDWSRIPVPPGLVRACNLDAARRVRELSHCLGAAFRPELLGEAQWRIDRRAELPYEVVRRLGNLMLSRAWLAGTSLGRWEFHAQGLVEIEQVRQMLKDLAVEAREERGTLSFGVAGARIHASTSSVGIVMPGDRDTKQASPALAEELKAAGFGADNAVWVYVRDAAGIPYLARLGVEKATLRVSFADGTTARAEVTCRDASAAAGLVTELGALKERFAAAVVRGAGVPGHTAGGFTWALADGEAAARVAALIRSVEVSPEGKRVTIRFEAVEPVAALFALVIAAWPE